MAGNDVRKNGKEKTHPQVGGKTIDGYIYENGVVGRFVSLQKTLRHKIVSFYGVPLKIKLYKLAALMAHRAFASIVTEIGDNYFNMLI